MASFREICWTWKSVRESLIVFCLFLASALSLVITVGIVFLLLKESLPFFSSVSLREFFGSTRWSPLFAKAHYGIWPLLSGTFLSTIVALVFVIPVGTMIAIYLSEFARSWVRAFVKPSLELLGSIPTVVYGYFALTFVTPFFQQFIPGMSGFNFLSAGLVTGVMSLPYVVSLAEDSMSMVPKEWREASYALGANRFQTACRVVYPSALNGILSGYILAVSRTIGETMIVSIAAGSQAKMAWSPLSDGQTMTSYIVQVVGGEVSYHSFVFRTVFVVGLMLFLITFIFNYLGYYLRKRFNYAT